MFMVLLYFITSSLILFCVHSNSSWFGVGSSYSGVYRQNTTDNIPPSSDVYYLLNFNNILTSYGNTIYWYSQSIAISYFLTSECTYAS